MKLQEIAILALLVGSIVAMFAIVHAGWFTLPQ